MQLGGKMWSVQVVSWYGNSMATVPFKNTQLATSIKGKTSTEIKVAVLNWKVGARKTLISV